MGSGRSSVLRIGSNPAEASSSGQTDGGYDNLAMMVHRVAPGERPFPLDKGKGKINKIRLPGGFEYLKAAIQNAEVVGPSRVEPSLVRYLRPDMGPCLGSRFGAPKC